MRNDVKYTFFTGDRFIQLEEDNTPTIITVLGVGFKFRQGFLRNQTIINNINVIDVLLNYCNHPNTIVNIVPSKWSTNVWKVHVLQSGMNVYNAEIRFSDDKFYETQLLKWKYDIKL